MLIGQIKDRLAKNNVVYKKPDTLMERISNMGPWLLKYKEDNLRQPKLYQRLGEEAKELQTKNKSQAGILQSPFLTFSLCALTQFSYFRKSAQLKMEDLNNSRAFSCPVGAFYM